MQLPILAITLLGMVLVAWFFISAVRAGNNHESHDNISGRRSQLIWGLLIFGIVVTVASLWQWPHDARAGTGAITVNATGEQWSWEIDAEKIRVGDTVVFNVHTKDVNHGLGVYDPSGTLLFQTQGMPGYVNRVKHVFTEPGTYRVLCLEFCGVAHHEMTAEFTVVAASD